MRSKLAALLLALPLLAGPTGARALVWPDVPQRIERALHSTDVVARRAAAGELRTLGASEASALIEIAIDDSDVDVRLLAADAAIHVRWQPATEKVGPWFADRETRLRIKACEVARAMPSAAAVPVLARALSDGDALVRVAAAEALAEQASPDAVPPLLGKLDDPSPPARIVVVRALAHLRDRRAVVPLVGKVQDSVSEVRREVARALGDLGDARASQALLLQLRDNISEVRLEALRSLGRLRAADAVDAIVPLAAEHTPIVRQTALEALGRIASPESIKALVAMLGLGDDATGNLDHTPVRDAIVSASVAAVPQVEAVLQAPTVSTTTATSAAWVLGEIAELARKDASVIRSIIDTVVAAMRRGVLTPAGAMRALGRTRDASAVPVVLEFALDASPQVRGEALEAAALLLDPDKPDGRVVEPLVAALRDPRLQAGERAEVATLLGRTGAARATPPLVSLVSAKDRTLRIAAIDALGVLGGAEDAAAAARDDVLVPLLSDADATLRLHVALALARAGGPKAREALLAKLDASEETDRATVLTALGGVLARVPTSQAVHRLENELDLSAGADRDAVLVSLARAKMPDAMPPLLRASKAELAADRRVVATVLGARTAAEGRPVLVALLADGDASVRSEAAWTLGELGDPSAAPALRELAKSGDMDSAIDATAALGRIAARTARDKATTWLCPLLDHGHAYVRANALAGLALSAAKCQDGSRERRLLQDDDEETVRSAAARALGARRAEADPDDTRALEACAATDRSGAVARRCRSTTTAEGVAQPLLVYVVSDDGNAPVPKGAYAIVLGDGLIHVGTTDRRGAVFDALTPPGEVGLARTSASIATR